MNDPTIVYSVSSVAAALGVTRDAVAKAPTPPPDVIMRGGGKNQHGWCEDTIVRWAHDTGRHIDTTKLMK